jgi:hypothetical protein
MQSKRAHSKRNFLHMVDTLAYPIHSAQSDGALDPKGSSDLGSERGDWTGHLEEVVRRGAGRVIPQKLKALRMEAGTRWMSMNLVRMRIE